MTETGQRKRTRLNALLVHHVRADHKVVLTSFLWYSIALFLSIITIQYLSLCTAAPARTPGSTAPSTATLATLPWPRPRWFPGWAFSPLPWPLWRLETSFCIISFTIGIDLHQNYRLLHQWFKFFKHTCWAHVYEKVLIVSLLHQIDVICD
jgi:hypothetical protein